MTGRHHTPSMLAAARDRVSQQIYRSDRKHVRRGRRDRVVYAAPYAIAAAVATAGVTAAAVLLA